MIANFAIISHHDYSLLIGRFLNDHFYFFICRFAPGKDHLDRAGRALPPDLRPPVKNNRYGIPRAPLRPRDLERMDKAVPSLLEFFTGQDRQLIDDVVSVEEIM